MRRTAHLSHPLEYVDTGPVDSAHCVVLLHGALMDERLWSGVVDALGPAVRCVVPILPMGAHRLPLPVDADLSPHGQAALVADLMDHLGLVDAVIVGNDTGGAVAQLLVTTRPQRVGGLALVSCDAFENFPPGLPGRTMALACRLPGGLYAAMVSLRLPALRRLPLTFGWMTRRPIDPAVFTGWLDAFLSERGVRRDVHRMMRAVDRHDLVEAADRLRDFDRPALVVWAAEDKVMPPDHARRLVERLPQADLVWVDDSYTLVPLDQPLVLATALREFLDQGDDLP